MNEVRLRNERSVDKEEEESHYNDEGVATNYESAFFYDNLEYRDWLLSELVPHITKAGCSGGKKPLRVADVGGGTGNFTAALAQRLGATGVLCVDPFEEMLKLAHDHKPLVQPVLMDAVEFAQREVSETEGHASMSSLDCVLLKEVIHHIPQPQWSPLFRGLHHQLAPGGVVVIITRPQEVEYPLFARAAEIWKQQQPPAQPYAEALVEAGFNVSTNLASYPVQIKMAAWLGMVRNKFWSTFSLCSEQELAEGVAALEERHAAEETLRFNDNLIFITATKQR